MTSSKLPSKEVAGLGKGLEPHGNGVWPEGKDVRVIRLWEKAGSPFTAQWGFQLGQKVRSWIELCDWDVQASQR